MKNAPELDRAAACKYLADRLGKDEPISKRTLQRYTKLGLLNPRQVKERSESDGRTHTLNVYQTAELDHVVELLGAAGPGASIQRLQSGAALTGKDERAHAGTLATRSGAEMLAVAVAHLLSGQGQMRDGAATNPVPIADRLTLSLVEASKLSGLSIAALREAVHAGRLKGKMIKGRRGFTVKRTDLEAFIKKL